jgi:hypothetical protein
MLSRRSSINKENDGQHLSLEASSRFDSPSASPATAKAYIDLRGHACSHFGIVAKPPEIARQDLQ